MSPAKKKKPSIPQAKTQTQAPTHVMQPVVVKTSESRVSGIRSFETSRHVIGYVVSGSKYIYSGDLRREAVAGDLFFLGRGTHYVEELPAGNTKPFEQIMFFYTPEQMGRIVANLSVGYGVETGVRHSCDGCSSKEHIVAPGWDTVKHFFAAIKGQLDEGFFTHNPAAEIISLTMLVYHIVARPEGCLRTKVLGSTDPEKELMERLIGEYVFSDISLEEFATKNNRSLSSFKKKFKEYFNESPHRWATRQRLMHSRLQLIQTSKSVTQIGCECCFPNTSHFIKLFRDEFGITPDRYRRKYLEDGGQEVVARKQKQTPSKKEPARQTVTIVK
jgi:AraC-like DNA-binding protein